MTYEQITRRAFKIWQQRQRLGIPGTSTDDWNQAEEELEEMEMVGDE